MKGLEFPIIGTQVLKKEFDLTNPSARKKYFEVKVGKEINLLKKFFKNKTFLAYFLGKKNSGKGTYSKLFTEIFGEDKVVHFSVGDMVRDIYFNWEKFSKSKKYLELKKLYRGYISFGDAVKAFLGKNQSNLIPTEFILALMKLKIGEIGRKTIFIDGLPRDLDQVSYSLFFKDLINFRDDPDLFILIDIPEAVINERVKYRVICSKCGNSKNTKLNISSKFEYDDKAREVYLLCDNPSCDGGRLVAKEGDVNGIESIRERINKDDNVIRTVFSLHGISKIFLRNHIPLSGVKRYFEDYEITQFYNLAWDSERKKVVVKTKSWVFLDDNGVKSISLAPAPVVVSLIKQLVKALFD